MEKPPHSATSKMEEEDESRISSYGSSYYINPTLNKALSNVSNGSEIKAKFAKSPDNVDLDKLFGFAKAKHLAGTYEPSEKEEESILMDGVVPHRIFVNHVDSFFGRHFVKHLTNQMFSFPQNKSSESEGDKSSDEEVEEEGSSEEDTGNGEYLENVESLEQDDDLEGQLEGEEEKSAEFIGDYDEDPFLILANEDTDDEEDGEIEKVNSLFPIERSDFDLQKQLSATEIGRFDLRKLKPEEYMELLDIETEEARLRFLKSLINRKHREKIRKVEEKIENKKLKSLTRRIKYSKTHKHFEIYGTLQRKLTANETESEEFDYLKNVHILDESPSIEQRDAFLDVLMTCGIVVFDLTSCLSNQVKLARFCVQAMTRRLQDEELQDKEAFRKKMCLRTFLLISPAMTWANTAPFETEEDDLSELAFIESDFRRRHPHENFKEFYSAENETLMCGQIFRRKFHTIVINTGVLYGYEEDVLDFLFVHTWKCEIDTPLFDPGSNLIPLIHVDSLSEIVYKCIRKSPFIKVPLIFAMESKCLTLEEICQSVSALGNGSLIRLKKELSIILSNIDQKSLDQLTTNLNLTPKYLVEKLYSNFRENFLDHWPVVCQEYIEVNRLKPLRILIDGLPVSGKTRLAMKLCRHYNIHYLNHDTIVRIYQDLLSAKEKELKSKQREKMLEERDGESEEEAEILENEELKLVQKKISDLKRDLYEANGRILDDKIMSDILARLLAHKKITNIGFVLDGWPNTYDLVKKMFDGKEDITPNLFIKMELDEKICLERIYNLSEHYLKKNPVDETSLIDRMFAYRNLNQLETTIASYFESDESQARSISLDANNNINFFRLCFDIGKPRERKFWIHVIGIDDIEVEEDAPERDKEAPDEVQIQKNKLQAFAEEELARRRKASEDEHRILSVYAEQSHQYAQRYLMPALCKGLIETVRTQPPDPVDFLAEYLFRNNEDGKVLTPTQRGIFGHEHTSVNHDEGFRQLQEMVAKKNFKRAPEYL